MGEGGRDENGVEAGEGKVERVMPLPSEWAGGESVRGGAVEGAVPSSLSDRFESLREAASGMEDEVIIA